MSDSAKKYYKQLRAGTLGLYQDPESNEATAKRNVRLVEEIANSSDSHKQRILTGISTACYFIFFIAFLSFCLATVSTAPEREVSPSTLLFPDQEIFYDSDGLIVHHGPNGELDGGDTAQREGWYWLGVWLRMNISGLKPWDKPRKLTFEQVIQLLEPNRDGVFYRHPKLPPWNDPHGKAYGFSRDQLEPLVAAMKVWGKRDAIRRLWNALPEDLLGKHALNGNWKNFLGQNGQDCSAIDRRGCDATMDCSLKTDDQDCTLQVDASSCGRDVNVIL